MREIKFRAWDKGQRYLWPVDWIRWETDGIKEIHITPDYKGGIMNDRLEIMQYTGLKDKNGVEIYEGDIVKLAMYDGPDKGCIPEIGVINWHEPASAFKWLSDDPSDGANYWLTHSDKKYREVIGNIYENPELTKGDSK